MNRSFTTIILILAALLGVTGCASFSIDPRVAGTYFGENSETLLLLPDARVFHTRMLNGSDERSFVGYYVTSSKNPRSLLFAGPDTSPFLGTSFHVSDDFSSVTVSWNDRRQSKDSWQIKYHKSPNTN